MNYFTSILAEDSAPNSKCIKKLYNDECFESWSSTKIKVVKLRHTWTIENFSFCSETPGEVLVSPTFSAGVGSNKSEWCLQVYPNGGCQDTSNFVAVFLKLIKFNASGIQTKVKIGIVNAKGEDVNIMRSAVRFDKSLGAGYTEFVKRDVLFDEEKELILEDKLVLFCEIKAAVGIENISGAYTRPQSDLVEDLAFLLENKELSDVTLSSGKKKFPAHKAILTARSPVFRVMFQHNMEESVNNRVEITDIDDEGLCEMLRYMYTGKIFNLKQMAPSLLNMGEKYEMGDLKRTCETALLESLTCENAAETFILSDTFGATELKIEVKKFIAAHASDVGITPGFESMSRTHPHLAVEAFCAPRESYLY